MVPKRFNIFLPTIYTDDSTVEVCQVQQKITMLWLSFPPGLLGWGKHLFLCHRLETCWLIMSRNRGLSFRAQFCHVGQIKINNNNLCFLCNILSPRWLTIFLKRKKNYIVLYSIDLQKTACLAYQISNTWFGLLNKTNVLLFISTCLEGDKHKVATRSVDTTWERYL